MQLDLHLNATDGPQLTTQTGKCDRPNHFHDENITPSGVRIFNTSQMTVPWINRETTKKAICGLDMIHQAAVLQNDIHSWNILVLLDGRRLIANLPGFDRPTVV
ncbi:hypothetical protein K439DRAFT_862649 [Ramaria rubella]|nr:hypothetical protein K439DRAFT_862649 [Ramaria rubella]